jgi:hypothetical protein
MMQIAPRLLSVLLALNLGLLTSSCAHAFGRRTPIPYTQPVRESCMVGEAGCVCFDPRRPEGEQHYTLSFEACRNYIAYHPSEYDTLQEWISRTCYGRPKLAE